MIKRIKIENFQSHKKTELDFSPGVNIIVGASDSGKTAIIRALRWLVHNRPTGDAFRSSWGGETRIQVDTDTSVVVRKKANTTNEYKLDGLKFNAFGTDVPEEISQALNLNEINLQSQFDQPFLLTASPGEVAAHFNRIAHIDQIDVAIKKVQSWIRDLEQNITYTSNALKTAEDNLQKYDYLEKAEKEIEVLEELEIRRNQKLNTTNRLATFIGEILKVHESIAVKSPILKLEDMVLQVLKKIEIRGLKSDAVARLSSSILLTKANRKAIRDKMKVVKLELGVDSIITLITVRNEKAERAKSLVLTLQNIRSVFDEYQSASDALETFVVRFNEEFPDICPLCDQPVKHVIC